MKTTAARLLPMLTLSASLALAHPDHDVNPEMPRKGPIGPIAPAEKAYGRQGDANQVTRTINLDLSDKMRFTPAEVTVRQGETIRFVVKNAAKVPQEMVLGTLTELKERAALVKKFPKMSVNQPNQLRVKAEQSGELVWQFGKAGEFNFACGAPACVDAGMIGKIVVSAP
jgi:uncharacterized cupredoxin-like copper-binding protein